MSSPASRQSQKARSQGTPRASRQNVPLSSPLFYRSSPAAAPNGDDRMNISSPLKEASVAGSTPRAPPGDSSPIRYAPSSSPTRALSGAQEPNIPTSSSGLFLHSARPSAPGSSGLNNSRRGDIHSDIFGATPGRRRRLFVDENGVPVRDGPSDPATFSNLDPNTSEADAIGGSSTRIIWGTNISIQDTMSTFKEFLLGYQKKYRMWADGATEEETSEPGSGGNEREYVEMLNNMRHLGVTGLNLDVRNLKAFPSTVKLWHQLQA